MPNRKNYPKDFSPYIKPYIYNPEPKPTLEIEKEIKKIQIYDGEELIFEPNKRYFFEQENDYDGGYNNFLVEKEVKTIPNPKYEKELEVYNKNLEKSKLILKEYNENLKRWKTEEAEETEARQKNLYEKLKKKYEKTKI